MPRATLTVDLDDALLRSDVTLESLFGLLKEQPLVALRLLLLIPFDKRRAADILERHRDLDAAHLAYDEEVLARLADERRSGTRICLRSRYHRAYANAVAEHLRLFDAVVTQPGPADTDAHFLQPTARSGGTMRAWLSAIRLHQWLKNLLIFVPLFASHWFGRPRPVLQATLAFLLFGLCASSVYLLNDLLDLSDDRHHPTKRFRALASGRIGVHGTLLVVPLFLAASLATAWLLLPWQFSIALATYYGITLAYSVFLKRVMMLDVVILAMLYTLRVIAGTLAINGDLTFWMLAFSLFIFMSLALAKRYAELIASQSWDSAKKVRGRGYFKSDLSMISSLGAASGYISVMVLALYVQDSSTTALYQRPKLIWLTCPLLLFWLGRTWMLTHRGQMHDDPLVFAIKDRASLVVAILFGLVFVFAT